MISTLQYELNSVVSELFQKFLLIVNYWGNMGIVLGELCVITFIYK